ncbi:MAG: hypothetical protein KC643_20470 [Nitrospira sp.]|nr:hypothetical protein [Nitrospira sp.]
MINKLVVRIFGMVLAIFFIYVGTLISFIWPIDEYTISQSGLFGDSFGVLTSLFSGLAFAGLLVTILIQKDQLDEQRKELATGSKLSAVNTLLNSSKLQLDELERMHPDSFAQEIREKKDNLKFTINICREELIKTLKTFGMENLKL